MEDEVWIMDFSNALHTFLVVLGGTLRICNALPRKPPLNNCKKENLIDFYEESVDDTDAHFCGFYKLLFVEESNEVASSLMLLKAGEHLSTGSVNIDMPAAQIIRRLRMRAGNNHWRLQ